MNLPTNFRTQPDELFYDFSSGVAGLLTNTKSGPGSVTVSNNTDPQYIRAPGASKSLKIDIDASLGSTTAILDINPNKSLLSSYLFGQRYFVQSGTVGEVAWLLSNDAGYANYYNVGFYSGPMSWVQGWNFGYQPKNALTVGAGAPNVDSTFQRIRMRIGCPAGQTLTLYLDSPVYKFAARPCLVFSFDDNHASFYSEAFSYMSPKSVPGSLCFTSANGVGGSSFTEAQGNEMLDAGWSIHNHSATHANYTTLTREQVKQELLTCRNYLRAKGWDRNTISVYPFGAWHNATIEAHLELGFTVGVTTFPQIARLYDGFEKPYHHINRQVIDNGSLPTLISIASEAIKWNAASVMIAHNIRVGAGAGETERDNFRGLIDWAVRQRDAGVLDILTLEELISRSWSSRRTRR